MTVRITYEHELEELNKDLREMAFMVEKAIEQTFEAFEDQNYTLAEDVIKGDRTVNDMERAIESRCLSLKTRSIRTHLRHGLRCAPDIWRPSKDRFPDLPDPAMFSAG